jgi:hypothetical protein
MPSRRRAEVGSARLDMALRASRGRSAQIERRCTRKCDLGRIRAHNPASDGDTVDGGTGIPAANCCALPPSPPCHRSPPPLAAARASNRSSFGGRRRNTAAVTNGGEATAPRARRSYLAHGIVTDARWLPRNACSATRRMITSDAWLARSCLGHLYARTCESWRSTDPRSLP